MGETTARLTEAAGEPVPSIAGIAAALRRRTGPRRLRPAVVRWAGRG